MQEFFYGFLHSGTVRSEFLRTSGSDKWLERNQKDGYSARSAYAVAAAIDPSVALETEEVHATVELGGGLAHGMMSVDWDRAQGRSPNVQLVKALDLAKVQASLANMVMVELVTHIYQTC